MRLSLPASAQGQTVLERDFATIPLLCLAISGQVFGHVNIGLSALCLMSCVPNLIAQPFDISREYMDIVYHQTQSPRLKWDEDDWGTPETARKLRTSFERFIELGPSPTLTGMVTCESSDDSASCSRGILCHAKNTKEVYYQYEDEPESLAEAVPTGTVSTSTTLVPAPIVAPVVDAAGPVASIPALSN